MLADNQEEDEPTAKKLCLESTETPDKATIPTRSGTTLELDSDPSAASCRIANLASKDTPSASGPSGVGDGEAEQVLALPLGSQRNVGSVVVPEQQPLGMAGVSDASSAVLPGPRGSEGQTQAGVKAAHVGPREYAIVEGVLPERPMKFYERNYVHYYATDVGGVEGNDQFVYRHANGLCVVGMAPSHAALKPGRSVTAVDFGMGKKRAPVEVTGKHKKNAKMLDPESSVCRITLADGATFTLRSFEPCGPALPPG
eukprot:jgi/Mesen1/2077/ME000151S01336